MRLYIFLIVLLVPVITFSQRLNIGLGVTSEKLTHIDIGYAGENEVIFKFDIGFRLSPGTQGEYYENVRWNEFPEDIRETGEYQTTINFGVGKYLDSFYVNGLIGTSIETLYQNRRDQLGILGNANGEYYTTASNGSVFNIGFEGGYIFDNGLALGGMYTIQGGYGIKISYITGI